MKGLRETFEFKFEVCWTCNKLLYDLNSREHYCSESMATIVRPHSTVCDDYVR